MDLIIGKPEIKRYFVKQWTTKYVPAIFEYESSSVKRSVSFILASIQQEGIFSFLCQWFTAWMCYFFSNKCRQYMYISGGFKNSWWILGESIDKKDSIIIYMKNIMYVSGSAVLHNWKFLNVYAGIWQHEHDMQEITTKESTENCVLQCGY